MKGKSFYSLCWWGAVAAVLSGCATVPDNLGRDEVNEWISARGYPVESSVEDTQSLVAEILAEPLTPQSAVQLALLNNPMLTSAYANLGFGAADLYAASRIRNPVFSASLLDPGAAQGRDQLTVGIMASIADLFTLGHRRQQADKDFTARQTSVAANVVLLASEAERAYYAYVGAKQRRALRERIAYAGTLATQLAQRFYDAGNISELELAERKAEASEHRLSSIDSALEAMHARGELAALLGLSIADQWDTPGQMHLPAATEDDLDNLLSLARESRLDLAAARASADANAAAAGFSGWEAWLGDLRLGYERERETDGVVLRGPTLEWALPVFTRGRDGQLRQDAQLSQSIAEVMRLSVAADNDVRKAHGAVTNARAKIVEIGEQLLPAQAHVVTSLQQQVSYGLSGVFELLSVKQDQYAGYATYLDAVEAYWLARADLARATGRVLPSAALPLGEPLQIDDLLRETNESQSDHHHHHSGTQQ